MGNFIPLGKIVKMMDKKITERALIPVREYRSVERNTINALAFR